MKQLFYIRFIFPLFFTSCLSLFPNPGPAPKLIALHPKEEKVASSPIVKSNIEIENSTSASIYDGTRIVLQKDGYYTYVQGFEWAEKLPVMISRLLHHHLLFFVGEENLSLSINLDISQFHIIFPNHIQIGIQIMIVDPQNNQILSTKLFEYKKETQNSMKYHVMGFEEVLSTFLNDCAHFIKESNFKQ